MRTLLRGLLAALVLGLPLLASAELATFEFRGTIGYSTYLGAPGTPVVGRFTWDAGAQTEVYSAPQYPYSIYQPPYTGGISAKVGAHEIASENMETWVYNDNGSNLPDMITVVGRSPVLDGTTFADGYFALTLASPSAHTLLDTSLPTHLEAQRFSNLVGQLFTGGTNNELVLEFSLESIRRVRH